MHKGLRSCSGPRHALVQSYFLHVPIRYTHPCVGWHPSFVSRQETLARDRIEEMKRWWRTRLESVPEDLGDIARELESCVFS